MFQKSASLHATPCTVVSFLSFLAFEVRFSKLKRHDLSGLCPFSGIKSEGISCSGVFAPGAEGHFIRRVICTDICIMELRI